MYSTEFKNKKTKEQELWIKRETKIQQTLYKKIVKQMDDLSEKRDKWYSEFLQRIQVYGFNTDGDDKQKIPASMIPVKPKRKDKVVW